MSPRAYLPLLASLVVASCQFLPLPTNQPEVPRPAAVDFPDVFAPASASPAPAVSVAPGATPAASVAPTAPPSAYDPFAETRFKDVETATKFAPTFVFVVDPLKAGATPGVTTDIYQTKGELEVRQVNMLVEHASFHFEKLTNGMAIGGGQVDIGTPPKLSVPILVKVDDTDSKSYAILSVRSDSPLAKIYLADLQIKVLYGSLSIVSIANASRANDKDGVYSTPASIRVVQHIDPGYVQLPSTAQGLRTRVIVTAEADPSTNVAGQRVYNNTVTITP
jgi:hypothetical protein